ncbi:PBP1A family penicillin-binding protein [Candidatus Nomurabacteria bacterium]|nr:PBP1A family penicillin-binding protein [Candidatus Nomurabacteria bacterium]
MAKSTKIYDRTGEVLLYDIHDTVKRRVVPLEQISKNVKNATIAIEDDQFYQHGGIQVSAIFRALLANLGAGTKQQGGSTITQQLVKNSLLTQDKSWSRKIKELVLSIRLEKKMSKDEILGHYLNEIPYGGNIYGVEEAAQTYFGKSALDVNLAEAAYLAAIPKAPTFYSPYGQNRDKLDERKDVVLARLAELGFITEAEHRQALAEKVTFSSSTERGIKAPHFVIWVRDYLENKYGIEALNSRGLKVTTTLDWPLQAAAEKIVAETAEENAKKFNAKNAGLVAIDPKTGQVLVMVGSKDYFNTEDEGNFNIILAHRQPGSAFKPFAYAEAFKKNFTPETMLFDLETQFDTACQNGGNCYKPVNYDNKFRGPMSMREALAQSINIPSIKTLYLAGINDTLALAKNMGITSLGNANQYGLTLVLGGGEVSPLELTSAYGVFANDGNRLPYTSILKVEDDTGRILEEFTPHPREVLEPNIARLISDVLSDNKAKIPSYGANSPLFFPNREVASKTGTTNDYKDAWIVGYTPSLVVGAWAGNNDNTPMEKKVAGLIIVPMWRNFMDVALEKSTVENFPDPEPASTESLPLMRGFWQGSHGYFTDKISGKIATEYTPVELREEHVLTQVHSILYWLDREDDPQFPLWEEPVRRWVSEKGIVEQTDSAIPTAIDDIHRPEFEPKIKILNPSPSEIYAPEQQVTIRGSYVGHFPIGKLEFFLNDQYLGQSERAPFDFTFIPKYTSPLKPVNELRIVAHDSVGNRSEIKAPLSLSVLPTT